MSAGGSPAIAVVDYGMGNLRSVEKALERVGAVPSVTRDLDALAAADGVVLPGVGAFPKAMEAIRALALDEAIAERVAAGTPTLGICLGMQLLFEESSELGGARGLGLLPGRVAPLPAAGLKIPQIGWNPVRFTRGSELTAGLPDPCPFYHVHSFAPLQPLPDPACVLGIAEYGSEFVSAVERASVFGVQFHPEKSGVHGLALLRNFAGICSAAATARHWPAARA